MEKTRRFALEQIQSARLFLNIHTVVRAVVHLVVVLVAVDVADPLLRELDGYQLDGGRSGRQQIVVRRALKQRVTVRHKIGRDQRAVRVQRIQTVVLVVVALVVLIVQRRLLGLSG